MFISCKGWNGKEHLGPAAGIPGIPSPVPSFCEDIAKGSHGPEEESGAPSQACFRLLVPHLSEQAWPVLLANVLYKW